MAHSSPYIIGVAGGSGSGKTTVVENLIKTIGMEKVSLIAHDHYYRDQSHLVMEERVKTNYDHPASLETELLVTHLQHLIKGESIQRPTYDFVRHTRSSEVVTIEPKPVIIVEGILIFESEPLRSLFNMKIFVDTDDDIRFIRRLERDVSERGRTQRNVIDQYLATVRPMYLQFVMPSRRYADIIIPEGGENQVALDVVIARIRELIQG